MRRRTTQGKRDRKRPQWVVYALIAATAGAAGFLTAHLWPHLIAGDEFWHDFITGPPTAGLFAVFAALIAFGAAAWTARGARENAALAAREVRKSAENAERWKRIEWAVNKALSANDDEAAAGYAACEALLDGEQCTTAETVMLKSALRPPSRDALEVDDGAGEAENKDDSAGGDQHG